MKLGYFMQPVHYPARDFHQLLAEDTEAILRADQLGFDEAWVGEHFTSSPEPITSPLIFMSNLIGRTKNIRFGTGVLCLPQDHPAKVAGYAALFDHLSEGRFTMGIGPGGLPPDFELFGVADADRGAMLLESIDTILEIWRSNPPYQINGKFWTSHVAEWSVPELELGPMAKPFQKPHPPIALAAMSPNSGTMRLAAQRDWEAISANFIGVWSVASHWATYQDECQKLGKTPTGECWRAARCIFVGDTNAEAEEFVLNPRGSFMNYYKYLYGIFQKAGMKAVAMINLNDNPEELTARDMVDAFVIRGDSNSVAEQIIQFRESVGPFGTLLMTAHDWVDKPKMLRSMELMAKEVMPVVNERLGLLEYSGQNKNQIT